MKRVAIIGMGLMGGSLGLALKRFTLAEIRVYARREETRRLAIAMGAADIACETPGEAVRDADMAVFCLPVCRIPDAAMACVPDYQPGCIVTDVGSTKAGLVDIMSRILRKTDAVFVGSHPMAGSEKNGLEFARADLYQGTVTAITPASGIPDDAAKAVTRLWEGVGSRVVRLMPDLHDRLVARTSHLPHLTAALLAATVGRDINQETPLFCGAGFRDTSRVASGPPDIWRDIVETNHEAILGELNAYGERLRELVYLLEKKDYEGIRRFLEEARQSRSDLLGK